MNYIYWKWTRNCEITKSKRTLQKNTEESFAIKTPEIDTTKNSREECCERISSREWIIQKNINPYLNQNTYVDDLSAQSEFLIPKDSNYNKKSSLS